MKKMLDIIYLESFIIIVFMKLRYILDASDWCESTWKSTYSLAILPFATKHRQNGISSWNKTSKFNDPSTLQIRHKIVIYETSWERRDPSCLTQLFALYWTNNMSKEYVAVDSEQKK